VQVDEKVHARRCNFHGNPFKAVGNGVRSNLGIARGGNITWKILLPILSRPESVFGVDPAASLLAALAVVWRLKSGIGRKGVGEGTRHEEKKGRDRERGRTEKGGESVNVAVQISRKTADQLGISRLIPRAI